MYRKPLAVEPEVEYRSTPLNYRRTYPGPGKLPDKIKVWRVQETSSGGIVAQAIGYRDSPDAEILVVGFNQSKSYGDVGVGRCGNFLQWGFGDPPSRMTEAGRRFFLNCIHYIHRFDGKAPSVRETKAGDKAESTR